MKNWILQALIVGSLWVICPTTAHAQYKNTSFGLDIAGQLLTRPGVIDPATGNPYSNDNMPDRLAQGFRLGSELNFKLHSDHWWFGGRLNLWLYQFATWGDVANSNEYNFDSQAEMSIGNIFGLEVVLGPRYYFLTDRIRPFIQPAVSYAHLFAFNSGAGADCSDASLAVGLGNACSQNGGTVGDFFFAHDNVFALHATFGVEFIVVRDVAVTVALDASEWIFFNSADNHVFTLSIGSTFYG